MSNIVPTNEASVFDNIGAVGSLERKAIVRPNNPPPGIAGFLFSIKDEESVRLSSDITDHYVENNTVVNDHISLKPEVVTLRGFVGELVMEETPKDEPQETNNPLPLNEEFLPEYTEIQEIEFDEAGNIVLLETATVESNASLYKYFDARNSVSTKQARAFAYFYQLWKGRQIFTVDTPWGFFTDMAIQELSATQDSSSKMVSSFSITFKKLRFASEVVIVSGQIAGRAAEQRAPQTNNGVAGKEPVTENENQSWMYKLTH